MLNRFGFFLFLTLALFITSSTRAQSLDCTQQHCMAVIDAGSTGSRLHIYSYNSNNQHMPSALTEQFSQKIKPGFATLDTNQAAVSTYLNQLFTHAPTATVSMPTYFYATAGMRLLPEPKQKQLYGFLKHWFENKSQWKLMNAKTITGREEGLLGWLAVNYQLHVFDDSKKQPMGVMDMGGASVQITFPVATISDEKSPDYEHVTVAGRDYAVFVHSFLGLGQMVMEKHFQRDPSCYPTEYILWGNQIAEGNATLCKNNVTQYMNTAFGVDSLVQSTLRTNPVQYWVALGGVAEMVQSTPFVFPSNTFSNQSLLEQGDNAVCHQFWSVLKSQYPTNEYLSGECFYSAYYYSLMVNGYGLDSEDLIHIMPKETNGDWTMGVVLRDAERNTPPL